MSPPAANPSGVSPAVEAGAGQVWAIVLGGGSGQRFGAAKQFQDLAGKPLLQHSIDAVASVADGVVVVVPDVNDPAVARLTGTTSVVAGGTDRVDSVRSGLAAVPPTAAIIVVADAAHPLASPQLFADVVQAVRAGADGAFPALPITEAITEISPDGVRGQAVDRAGRVLIQMPQAYSAQVFRGVHALVANRTSAALEDSELVARTCVQGRPGTVVAVPGDPRNLHVTTPAELAMVRAFAGWSGLVSEPEPGDRPPPELDRP